MQNEAGEELFCVCETPNDTSAVYLQCAYCDGWFHPACINVDFEVRSARSTASPAHCVATA
jgi:hypothetical protein